MGSEPHETKCDTCGRAFSSECLADDGAFRCVAADLRAEVERLKAEVERLRDMIDSLQADLSAERSQKAYLRERLGVVMPERDTARAEVERLQVGVAALDIADRAGQAEIKRLKGVLAAAREWMAEDGCDCGTDEPGTCALCQVEAAVSDGE